ncbi:hypothetical protein KUH32_01915 [Thalassococcus sp. CAU 1522]|uniref:CBU-0592-like domain-containing protein n=1 Tax=Thalassococcus arenae TaxID=2851652 RepID=A0ABS6N3C0_9RHOB|nr:hypothetical protein [Thalassococcus arenae]MBV2358519.1 hypothetical protein [Thalassococcus arenae]
MTAPLYNYDLADLCNSLGILGFMAYVANYLMLSFRVLSSESVLYFVINTSAATLVLISLTQEFNMASALIQGFWITIGICAIAIRVRLRLRERRRLAGDAPFHHHQMRRERSDHALYRRAETACYSTA